MEFQIASDIDKDAVSDLPGSATLPLFFPSVPIFPLGNEGAVT
jgi:hypothetical protein